MIITVGILIPFLGTTLGAACVFLFKDRIPDLMQKAMLGFASGVMVAASVWSLLIPSMDIAKDMGKFSVLPAALGLAIGVCFLFLMDKIIPHLHINEEQAEGPKVKLKKTTMLMLAVTLHNIPEGMAVGVTLAGAASGNSAITISGALALSIGIAIQNFPEGAVISLPMFGEGNTRGRSFTYGMLSGIVEPIAAILTIIMVSEITVVLPYLLAFAAGAMLYVVVEELIPEASKGEHSNIGTLGFVVGFILMMVLDVVLS